MDSYHFPFVQSGISMFVQRFSQTIYEVRVHCSHFVVGKGEPTQAPPSTGMEGSGTQDQGSNRKPAPLPNISLGLPTIPSGTRATKSFTYPRNEGKNFTLGMY